MIKIKDIIEKLQELNEEEYIASMEIEPIVTRLENISGDGIETIKYRYTITLEGQEETRKYKNKYGMIEYVKD